MALATKCPKCGSTFRVVADQLKLRGGLVRCGQCRTVFDAIGSLAYVDEASLTPAPSATPRVDVEAAIDEVERPEPPAPAPAVAPARPRPRDAERPRAAERALEKKRRALGPATTLRISPGATPVATISEAAPPAAGRGPSIAEQAQSATGVPTLIIAGAPELPPEAALDGIEVIEIPAVAEPTRMEEAAAEPQFLREPPRERRGFSIVFGGGSLLLALLAVAQLAVIFRGEVLRHWPGARPALVAACDVLRCTVGWPTQPAELAVIASELQAIAGTDVLELTTVVRNRAAFTQALPALEVTLSDTQNRPLARKVFTPVDYLEAAGEPARRLDQGLAPGADLTIRLFIEARGLQPAGFLVYPFYI
jgi:predicted Zn finger-like uncharacterized protein